MSYKKDLARILITWSQNVETLRDQGYIDMGNGSTYYSYDSINADARSAIIALNSSAPEGTRVFHQDSIDTIASAYYADGSSSY